MFEPPNKLAAADALARAAEPQAVRRHGAEVVPKIEFPPRFNDPVTGLSARPLRDPLASRRGRDGGGVPGAGYALGAGRRRQGPVRALVLPARAAPAVRAGGEGNICTVPSARLRDLRRGQPGRGGVPRHGVPGRGEPGRASGEWKPLGRSDASLGRGDRGGSRRGASARNRAQGPEARQCHVDEVGRETSRLRAGQTSKASSSGGGPDLGADGGERSHQRGDDPRNRGLYGSGANRGEERRPTNGHLRARRGALRDGNGAEGLHWNEPGLTDRLDPERRASAYL